MPAIGFWLLLLIPAAPDVDALLAKIKAVNREGNGNAEATKAWRDLTQRGPDALLPILAAMDDANPTTTNWLRIAADGIAENALTAKQLPAAKLEAFVKDTQNPGRGRRTAYEWLVRLDATAADRLLPTMLNDPNAELRREGVARALHEAEKSGDVAALQKVFTAARDRDQVDQLAKLLQARGTKVDLAAHFGFVRQWRLVGPFDHTGGIGFAAVYPPEKGVDLKTTYKGKNNAELRWQSFTTDDPYGLVDLNKALTKHMGAVGYAFAVIDSPEERPVEVRVGSNNAVKIFLNGKLLFYREEYHHGQRMDQHVGAGILKKGRNEVLLKVCQNEQTDQWAQSWSFQARICDPLGGAVPFTVKTGEETR
jgi:hypothetical protein